MSTGHLRLRRHTAALTRSQPALSRDGSLGTISLCHLDYELYDHEIYISLGKIEDHAGRCSRL